VVVVMVALKSARKKHCEKLTSRRIRTYGFWISGAIVPDIRQSMYQAFDSTVYVVPVLATR